MRLKNLGLTASILAYGLCHAGCSVYQSGDREWFNANAAKVSAASLLDPSAPTLFSSDEASCFLSRNPRLVALVEESATTERATKPVSLMETVAADNPSLHAVFSPRLSPDTTTGIPQAAYCEFTYPTSEALALDLEPARSRAESLLDSVMNQTQSR